MILSRLINRIHTDPGWLQADPWRAYRLVLLAARFDIPINSDAIELIRSIDYSGLDRQRVFTELSKLLFLSVRPSRGFRYMLKCGILEQLHPLLHALVGCRQEKSHHPEGDVFEHTMLVVDQCRLRMKDSGNPQALMLAALLHDIGKPVTIGHHKGKVTSYGHDVIGSKMAASFLTEFKAPPDLVRTVQQLVREHMQPVLLYKQKEKVSNKAIRRLLGRVNVDELLLLSEADYLGRGGERDYRPIRDWLCRRIERLKLSL